MRRFLSFIATVLFMATASPAFAVGQTYNLQTDFSAACDGVTDDTVAIQNWLNALGQADTGTVGPGICVFTSPLTKSGDSYSIIGSGSYATLFQYTGSNTNVDLITFQSALGGPAAKNIRIQGIKIFSSTVMSGGAAFRFKQLARSFLLDVVAGGQDNPGTLFHGFWFDQVASAYVAQIEANGRGDCVRMNGNVVYSPEGGGKFISTFGNDLGIAQGKLGGCNVGIHVGGGFGGLYVDQVAIIGNSTNVLIDHSLNCENISGVEQCVGNREIFLGSTSAVDSAMNGDGIHVDDSLAGGATLTLAGWIASGTGNGVNIVNWPGILNLSGNNIYNFDLDGVRISDPITRVNIDTGLNIRNNDGYGINATVPTFNILPGSNPADNGLGPYSANAHIQDLNPLAGYQRYPDGRYQQWVTRSVSGPANTFLGSPSTVALPIAFPNFVLEGTIEASQGGFANGAAVGTVSCTAAGLNAVNLLYVSPVAVTNPQFIRCSIWGR